MGGGREWGARKKGVEEGESVGEEGRARERGGGGEGGGEGGGGGGGGGEGEEDDGEDVEEGKAKKGRKRSRPKSNQSEKATKKKVPGPPVHDGDSSSMDANTGSLKGSLKGLDDATDETNSMDDVKVRGARAPLYIFTFSVATICIHCVCCYVYLYIQMIRR